MQMIKSLPSVLDENIDNFDEMYEGWNILFSSIRGNIEEENTTRLLQTIANEAGWNTKFAYIDEVEFSDDGIFYNDGLAGPGGCLPILTCLKIQ
jgi:glutathionylspermidine synthase